MSIRDENKSFKQAKRSYIKPFKYIFTLLFGLALISLLIGFHYQFQTSFVVALFFLLIAFIVLLIGHFYALDKAVITALFPKLIEKINLYNSHSLIYLAYPKELSLVFKDSGLFSLNTFSRVRYAIENEENPSITLLNLSIIMSTGSASREIFKGGLIKILHQKDFHALVNQAPGFLEDVHYEESSLQKSEMIYIEEGKEVFLDELEPYLKLMHSLKERYHAQDVRLSITPKALYIAFKSKKLPTKLRTFKEPQLNEIYDSFKQILHILSQ